VDDELFSQLPPGECAPVEPNVFNIRLKSATNATEYPCQTHLTLAVQFLYVLCASQLAMFNKNNKLSGKEAHPS
jgi:hypothetical protein